MAKKKPGRKDYVIMKIVLSEADTKMLKRQAKGHGLSVSRYVGSLILEYSRNDPAGRLKAK